MSELLFIVLLCFQPFVDCSSNKENFNEFATLVCFA